MRLRRALLLPVLLVSGTTADARTDRARVERLIGVLPLSENQTALLHDGNRERLVLESARPDKLDILAPIYTRFERCVRERMEVKPMRAVRRVIAKKLSTADVDAMYAFYTSDDFKRFGTIADKAQAGGTLSDEEQAFMTQASARPFMKAFYDGLIASAMEEVEHPTTDVADADCAGERTASIAALGIAPATIATGTMP